MMKPIPNLGRLACLLPLAFSFACGSHLFAADPATNGPLVLKAADFGVKGDGVADDIPALNKALEAAKAAEPRPVVISLAKGKFRLSSSPVGNEKAHLILQNMKNVTLQGQEGETELIMTDPYASGVMVGKCENVRLENICVDYDPLPYTQGTIVAADPALHSFDIKLSEGYVSPLVSYLSEDKKNRAYIIDPATRIMDHNYDDQYPVKIDDAGQGTFRYFSHNHVLNGFVGQMAVIVGRSKSDAVLFENSFNCTASHLTVYSSPATGFKVRANTGRIFIDHCRLVLRPGTDRLFSTNADGIHAKFNRAGLTITNCEFTHMGDDGLNISGTYQPVFAQVDPVTLLIGPSATYRVGDKVTLSSVDSGGVIGESSVAALKSDKWNGQPALRVSLSSPVKASRTVQSGAVPKKADQLTCAETVGAGSIIKDNYFGKHRARGIIMHAPGSVIEGNTFESLSGPAIVVGPDFSWGESMAGNDLTIRNNRFIDIRRSNIDVAVASGGDAFIPDSPAATKNILIEGNNFSGYGQPNPDPGRGIVGNVIFLSNTENVQVQNNTIGPRAENTPRVPEIILTKARGITLSNNKIAGATGNDWLEVKDNVNMNSVTIK